jgi:hypothetical protein
VIYKSASQVHALYKEAAEDSDARWADMLRQCLEDPEVGPALRKRAQAAGVSPQKLLKKMWAAYGKDKADERAAESRLRLRRAFFREVKETMLYGAGAGAVTGGLSSLTKHPALTSVSYGPLTTAFLAGSIGAAAGGTGKALQLVPAMLDGRQAVKDRHARDMAAYEGGPRFFGLKGAFGERLREAT